MRRILNAVGVVIVVGVVCVWLLLFRPFLRYPEPAALTCLDPSAGRFEPLGPPTEVYGLGLSYAGHIAESPGLYSPGAPPPVFRKRLHSVNRSATVPYPTGEDLLAAVAIVDAAQATALRASAPDLPPLLDYEVEIGINVREPIELNALRDPTFGPPVGFFVVNDLTARMLIAMAPSFDQTVDYLAEGKGLPGFLPVGDQQWVPNRQQPDGWVCVDLVTEVNGVVRQRSPSTDIIVSPREILMAVAEAFDLKGFATGDWVVTGTPPGVALQTAGWMQRAAVLIDPSAETKIRAMARADATGAFLRPGDVVEVSAGFLGKKSVRVVGHE